ncbi:replication protein [uncultured marine virus]|nr:replication protein [uncultured marine virus]
MDDTIVKPGYIAYQFRVDVDKEEGLTLVMSFMKKYDVQYYIVGAETSENNKDHFQCILWFNSGVNTTKLRNWWTGKTLKTKQPVSMTSAKKIKSLAAYAMKDTNFITNLTKEELEKIPQWKVKSPKIYWGIALDEHANKFKTTSYDDVEGNGYIEHEFYSYMLDYYKSNFKRPSRATLQYLAWKHGYITNSYLITKWF